MLEKSQEYVNFLKEIKQQIQQSRIKASLAINQELIRLYWNIGRQIVEKQEKEVWGAGVIEKLAKDLQNEFPGIKGFSRVNIFRMRQFFLLCQKVSQAGRQLNNEGIPLELLAIPWRHTITLLHKFDNPNDILWYAQKVIEHSWSRSILEDYIRSDLHKRLGKAITNFQNKLPAPQSQLAQETLKDPYNFDFLAMAEKYHERELETGLLRHIEKFLLELGAGFAFIGRQYHLKVSEEDYYLDLLFYHTQLRCYCVVELKNTAFKPEYAGKLNFYLSVVDDQLKQSHDQPTIGILLCKTKNKVLVEYALRDVNKPIGVAGYETKILESLPENLKGSLPTVEEIEEEFLKNE
jgi:predicted nuclease of restriction endonuclease-like (RecB) superfamily